MNCVSKKWFFNEKKKNYRLSCFLICGDMQVHHKNTCLTGHKNTLAQLVCRMCGHLPLLLRDCPLFFHSFLLFWHVLSFLFFFWLLFSHVKVNQMSRLLWKLWIGFPAWCFQTVSKTIPKRFQNQSKTLWRWFGLPELFPNRFGIDLESVWKPF